MSKKDKPFNNPFYDAAKSLKKRIKTERKEAQKQALKKAVSPPVPSRSEDEMAFIKAFSDITPQKDDGRGLVTPPLPPGHSRHIQIHDEEAEALAELASLIDGTGKFDISDSDEFIAGCAEGLDRRILRKLKAGDYALGAHLDLHGLNREEAFDEVVKFINRARLTDKRCVLIVHGRGLNSKDNIPVLKGLLKNWLERGRISKSVLAFCTALPHDGGAGAVYVLLRR